MHDVRQISLNTQVREPLKSRGGVSLSRADIAELLQCGSQWDGFRHVGHRK